MRVQVAPQPYQYMMLLVFNSIYSDRYEVVSHYGFVCISLMTNDATQFSCVYLPFICLLL